MKCFFLQASPTIPRFFSAQIPGIPLQFASRIGKVDLAEVEERQVEKATAEAFAREKVRREDTQGNKDNVSKCSVTKFGKSEFGFTSPNAALRIRWKCLFLQVC